MFKKIFRNTSFLFLGKSINYVLALFLLIIISRTYGVEGFGQYALIFVFMEFFYIFLDLGQSEYAIREISRNLASGKKYLNNLISIKLILWLFIYLIMIISVNLLSNSKQIIYGVYIIGFALLFNSLIFAFISIFRSHEKMEFESYLIVVEKVITVSLSILFILLKLKIVFLIIAYFLGVLFSFFIGYLMIIKKFFKIKFEYDIQFIKNLFFNAFPFFLSHSVSNSIFRLNVIILFYFQGSIAVGIYEAANKIIKQISIYPQLFIASVYPVLSKLFLTSKKKLKKIYCNGLFYSFLLNLFILIGLLFFSKKIILLIYGKEFISSILVLKLSSIVGFFIFMNYFVHIYLNAVNKAKINVYISLFGFIINIILSMWLIPRYNYFGIIFVNLFVFSFITCIKIVYIKFQNKS